jgi:glycopeptide antibiotics resistance protein
MGGTHVRLGYLHEFAPRSSRRVIADVVTNVALFVPLGWSAHRVLRGFRIFPGMMTIITVTGAVALYSLAMETVQYFLPSRYSSILDVAANTVGGSLGAWLERRSTGMR